MKTEEDPEETPGNRLREIADLALGRAVDKVPDPNLQPTPAEYVAHLREVWVDWKLAQAAIVKDLLDIHVHRTALQELGREAHDSHKRGPNKAASHCEGELRPRRKYSEEYC